MTTKQRMFLQQRLGLAALVLVGTMAVSPAQAQYPSTSQVKKDGTAVVLEDFASLPLSSPTHGGVSNQPVDPKGQLARVTSLRSEPSNAPRAGERFFVIDQNNTIYILEKSSKKFTPLLKFADIFPKFVSENSPTVGIVSITFDPEYAKNGKFYTVHTEKPTPEGSAAPVPGNLGKLDLKGFELTATIKPPAGPLNLESVMVEWTDKNVRDAGFEGTAREIMRVGYERNHPMADMIFNPLARRGDADYGNLYVSVGDGGQGETVGPGHTIPQRLDAPNGKIFRITPDITLRPNDMLSANGRYRIPSTGSDPNPFITVKGALPEIFAYGFRNPHRLTWDIPSKALLVCDIGARSWEEINVVQKGGNYGFAEREGGEQLFVEQRTSTGSQLQPPVAFPEKDRLTVEGLNEPVVPIYPAAVYTHRDGDSLGSGFVYRGKLMPQLRGKYIFNDMTTGRIFFADLDQMLATQGVRNRVADVHELQILYKNSTDPKPMPRRMFDIVADTYAKKGGQRGENVLPGAARNTTGFIDQEKKNPISDYEGVPYGGGRADVRIAVGGDGEIYVVSKSDGMIRKMVSSSTVPLNQDIGLRR